MAAIRGLLCLLLAGGLAAPASAVPHGRQPLRMLDQLEPGRWEVRLREPGTFDRMCLRSGHRLVQLRHPQHSCERVIISDEPEEVTVQYTCRGKGYGRTQIRRESDRLVQIEAQGIADGLPFSFAAEARWIGAC